MHCYNINKSHTGLLFYVHPVHVDNFNVAPNRIGWMRQRNKVNESSAAYDLRDEMRLSGLTLPRRREIKRASRYAASLLCCRVSSTPLFCAVGAPQNA